MSEVCASCAPLLCRCDNITKSTSTGLVTKCCMKCGKNAPHIDYFACGAGCLDCCYLCKEEATRHNLL